MRRTANTKEIAQENDLSLTFYSCYNNEYVKNKKWCAHEQSMVCCDSFTYLYNTSICNRNFFISLSKASLSLSNFSRLPHSSVFSNCNLSICQ